MRSAPLTSTAMLATIVLVGTACGGSSDNDSGGSDQTVDTAEYCEELAEFTAEGEAGDGMLDEESMVPLRALRDAAPDEIRDDMTLVVDVLEKLTATEEDEDESLLLALALASDPAFIEASENIDAYAVDVCGLEPSVDGSSIDGSTGLVDPLYDPTFDDPVDPSFASIDGLQLHLDETYPQATWRPQLSSFGFDGDEQFQVGGVGVDTDAIAICEAVLGYSTGFSPEASVVINSVSDDFNDETPIATGTAAEGCITV